MGISAPIKVEKRNKDIETISVFALKSFSGIALSFQTDEELDEYQLFAVREGKKKLLCSTNVPVLNSKEIFENEKYYVEGFDTKDGNITLCAKSEIFLCNPLLEQPSTTSPFLSIIIPVYNCEEFIERTIDSVLLSTYKDTEIILVDDGSTDKSPEICDWYAEKYAKIKCLHIAHGDVCKARNIGLNESAGEFVAFVDADDLVHPLMYQRLVKAALDNNSDIAIGQTYTLRYNKETKLFFIFKEISRLYIQKFQYLIYHNRYMHTCRSTSLADDMLYCICILFWILLLILFFKLLRIFTRIMNSSFSLFWYFFGFLFLALENFPFYFQ